MRGLLPAIAVLLGGCGAPKTAAEVFDRYLDAYMAADGAELWELSTPSARAEVDAVREALLRGLRNPDPAERLAYHGTFGVKAADIEMLDRRDFFVFAVGMIHKRLATGFIRRTVSRWKRVRVEPVDAATAVVVYRDDEGRENRLRLKLADGAWRVDQSPFPQEQSPAGASDEPGDAAPGEPVRDFGDLYDE